MTRSVVAIGLILAAGLSACSTMRNARDRLVRTLPACEDISVAVYFARDAAELTADGRRVVKAAAEGSRGCTVDEVRVLGLADATGGPEANLALSRRRAASVAEAIAQAGLPPAQFDVSGAGETGAVTKGGAVQPVRRRVDVLLRLSRPK